MRLPAFIPDPLIKLLRIFSNSRPNVIDGGRTAVVRVPLSADDIDRAGRLPFYRISCWFHASRMHVFHLIDPQYGSPFLDFEKLLSESEMLYFTVASSTHVNESIYGLLDRHKPPLLSAKSNLGYVGNSSVNMIETISDDESGSLLARNVIQFVVVDRETRRPAPIPGWWKDKYSSFVVENQKLLLPVLQVPKTNVFEYAMKPTWNDTDYYQHINYKSYINFCFDAAMEAVRSKFYTGFRNEILNYGVKCMKASYLGESRAGDPLVVSTWQDFHNPRMLHFSFDKDGKIIFQSSTEFYD